MIKQLLEKWACKHEWKKEAVIESFETTKGIIYLCKKCGKFKTIRAY